MAKVTFNKKENLSTSKLDLNIRKTLMKCSIWNTALYGADTWILSKKKEIRNTPKGLK